MHHILTAAPGGQRLATAMGAVIAALACAVALPAHAQAGTTAWSTQKPPPGPCGPARSVSTGYGSANIKDCLKIARSASGTYYYNGVLEVEYHRLTGYVGDVLGGKSMITRVGDRHALGVNDCPRKRWINDQKLWCYSPTKSLPRRQRIYGKGVLLNHAGRSYPPVWSPVITAGQGAGPSNSVIFIHGLNRGKPASSNCATDFGARHSTGGFKNGMRRALTQWGHSGNLIAIAYYRDDRSCDASISDHGSHFRGHGGRSEHYVARTVVGRGDNAHVKEDLSHSSNTDIRHLGYHLAWYIWDEFTSKRQTVDVVAHSMGGLLIRYALAQTQRRESDFPPYLLVQDVVTMGTPHGGARAYSRLCTRNDQCSQMLAGSAFLKWLEERAWNPQSRGGTDWSTFGSDRDLVVAPDRAAATDRDRDPVNQYMGSCHKVWYRGSAIGHSDYMSKQPRGAPDVYRRDCPGGWVREKASQWPVRRAFLAISSKQF